jgi:chromosome partitioning protein
MIVAIASVQHLALQNLLATNLAVLRARNGRRICLIDTDPRRASFTWSCARSAAGVGPEVPARTLAGRSLPGELEEVLSRYNEVLISTEERDTHESRSALIAAHTVVVPLEVAQANLNTRYRLIARLNSARMFNPGLRVLFVLVCGELAPTAEQMEEVRSYVAHVMAATLASTIIHAPCAHYYGQGRCVSDAETCDPDIAAQLHALYDEVYIQ